MAQNKLKVAVVTGEHPYDNVLSFQELFRSIPEIDCYHQDMMDFANDLGGVRGRYDVALFYNMHMELPADDGPWFNNRTRAGLERLGETEQGIFMFHHSILAYPKWPFWADIVGVKERKFDYFHDQSVRVEVIDHEHPITKGLKSWEMVDETYTMDDAGEGSRILMTIDHPKSMKTVAWTREFRKSRVFCFRPGHDYKAFDRPELREAVRRGILWAAKKI